MADVGYARVSSVGQNLDVQLTALAHCEKVFSEKRSGVDRARPQFNACMEYLREGDTLYVTKFDRLARSTAHLMQIVETLQAAGVNLVVIDQALDTSTSAGRAMVGMLAVFAQFELEIRAERQMDGVARAQERGVKFGRKASLTPEQADELRGKRAGGTLIKDLMAEYGLSKKTVYNYLNAK